MHTIFDWVTLGLFAGLVILFLHRSVDASEYRDSTIQYVPPAVACAIANYAGNHGYETAAIAIVLATVTYIILVLKPFGIPSHGDR